MTAANHITQHADGAPERASVALLLLDVINDLVALTVRNSLLHLMSTE